MHDNMLCMQTRAHTDARAHTLTRVRTHTHNHICTHTLICAHTPARAHTHAQKIRKRATKRSEQDDCLERQNYTTMIAPLRPGRRIDREAEEEGREGEGGREMGLVVVVGGYRRTRARFCLTYFRYYIARARVPASRCFSVPSTLNHMRPTRNLPLVRSARWGAEGEERERERERQERLREKERERERERESARARERERAVLGNNVQDSVPVNRCDCDTRSAVPCAAHISDVHMTL